MLSEAPRLFRQAISDRGGQMLALACEMSVPPLALLVTMLCDAASVSFVAARMFDASWLPFCMVAGALVTVAGCLLAAWTKFGRFAIPLRSLLAAPRYVA